MPRKDSKQISDYKNAAKTLLKSYQAGDATAKRRISQCFSEHDRITLQRVQLVVARELGFNSWKQLLADKGAKPLLHCSFCGNSHLEVRKLIAGPGVFVCDNCVALCNNIIHDETMSPEHAIPVTGVELSVAELRDMLTAQRGEDRLFVRPA